ncbi:Lar family restriction alleviation protein [Serratia fonticola]|uniref:Lar family restriction alleviation protein n=1 Tax=Serratia fonticola TaxID=47917 RepID=UPI003CC7DFCB
MKNQEIKPCPSCGENADFKQCSKYAPHDHLFMVGCPYCGFSLATGPVGIAWFNGASAAISAWNTREGGRA